MILVYIIAAFLCGALPFSVWIGRYALNVDIREYGDGNPGATNVLRAGGVKWGIVALVADLLKAAIPVGLGVHVFGFNGLASVLIAVAPPFGHAFSPFLSFRGGKAIAATAGTWIGISMVEVAFVMMCMLILWFRVLTSHGWAVIFASLSILVYLVLWSAPVTWFAVWGILFVLTLYKHANELTQPPRLKIMPGENS